MCDSVPTSVEGAIDESFLFKLFPNPTIDEITLSIELPSGTQGAFRLYNAMGQFTLKQELHELQSSYVISLVDLESGIYFYEVSGSDKVWKTGKLVVHNRP